jgi:hypothetical protein
MKKFFVRQQTLIVILLHRQQFDFNDAIRKARIA